MKSIEKILKLIDRNDVASLLSDVTLTHHLNELFKYALIEFKNDRITLTSKGMEARIQGVEKYISDQESKEETKEFSVAIQRKEIMLFKACFVVTVLLGISLLILSLTRCSISLKLNDLY